MSWLALEGKTAVVTGGASGIGKAVVQAFLDMVQMLLFVI